MHRIGAPGRERRERVAAPARGRGSRRRACAALPPRALRRPAPARGHRPAPWRSIPSSSSWTSRSPPWTSRCRRRSSTSSRTSRRSTAWPTCSWPTTWPSCTTPRTASRSCTSARSSRRAPATRSSTSPITPTRGRSWPPSPARIPAWAARLRTERAGGEVKLEAAEGPGCSFRDRCPHRYEPCDRTPPFVPLGPGRASRCWLD